MPSRCSRQAGLWIAHTRTGLTLSRASDQTKQSHRSSRRSHSGSRHDSPEVFLVPLRRAPPFQNRRYSHPVVPESKRCTVVPRLEHDTLRQILCFVPSRTTVACYRFSNQSVRFCRQQQENISFLQWPNVVACRTASPLACCVVSAPHSTEAFEPLHQGLAESREGAHQNRQDSPTGHRHPHRFSSEVKHSACSREPSDIC